MRALLVVPLACPARCRWWPPAERRSARPTARTALPRSPRRERHSGSAPPCKPGRTRRPMRPSATAAAVAGMTSPTATAKAAADAECPEGKDPEDGIAHPSLDGNAETIPVGPPAYTPRDLHRLVHDQGGRADRREPRDRGVATPRAAEQRERARYEEPGFGEVGEVRHLPQRLVQVGVGRRATDQTARSYPGRRSTRARRRAAPA